MKKIKLLSLLILLSISGFAQWSQTGNTLQRAPDGAGFKYRFNLGAPGYFSISDTLRKYLPLAGGTMTGRIFYGSGNSGFNPNAGMGIFMDKNSDYGGMYFESTSDASGTSNLIFETGDNFGDPVTGGNEGFIFRGYNTDNNLATDFFKISNESLLYKNNAVAIKNDFATGQTIGANTTGSADKFDGFTLDQTNINYSGLSLLFGRDNTTGVFRQYNSEALRTYLGSPVGGETLQSVTDRNSNLNTNIMFGAGKGIVGVADAIITANDGVLGAKVYAGSTGQVTFGNGNTQVGTFLGNGNFGIGTPSPTEKLEVNGSIKSTALAGIGTRNVVASPNGTIGTTTDVYLKAADIANGQTIGANTNGSARLWAGENLGVSNKNTGDFIYYNGTNWVNKAITATAPLIWNPSSGNLSINTATIDGKANLVGSNTFSGGINYFNGGYITPFSGYSSNGFLNTVQSTTLTANVSTEFPSDGGVLANQKFAGYKSVKTTSGNGVLTTISLAHGLVGITSGSYATAIANNAASAGIQYVTVDANNINIFYTVAPVSGTNNLIYSIEIKP